MEILSSFVLILFCGWAVGEVARKLGAPPLLGMMLAGVFLGSEGTNLLGDGVLALADDLRSLAVTIILMRAGLGLDRDKLAKQGTVALRLGFLPALTEALAIAIVSIWLLDFNWLTGLLLGCVVSAESPAVIVPGMLRLKNLGWGVAKGIADAILTGSALSDVLVLLLFSLLINFATQGDINGRNLWLLPLKAIAQIILGVIVGYLAAKLIVFGTVKQKWTRNKIQTTLVVVSIALGIVISASYFPYFSGYLGVMAMGFFLIQFNPPLSRILRQEFNHLWVVAEIILFVLMGATIQLNILENILLPGLLLLVLGLLLGRSLGWYLATSGSNWTLREKLFLLPGNSAKATVQAAIGAIPLSLGIAGGDKILAIAALSIIVTAPLGAWAIPTFAPRLLTQDKVDPTKTNVINDTVILGIIDRNAEKAIAVLTKVADLARRTNGKAIIVCSFDDKQLEVDKFQLLTNKLLLDISHQYLTIKDRKEIITITKEKKITEIIIPKRNWKDKEKYIGYFLNRFVLKDSNISIILV